MRQTFNLTDDHRLLILVGTNFMRKGVDRALDALAALPPELKQKTKLMLVGNDPRDKVEKLAQQRGLADNFIFTGPRQDVHELLLAADVMIHPAREEGTGTVLVEALAAGLPTLCTQECGFSPYVKAATDTVIPKPYRQDTLNQVLLETLTTLPIKIQRTKDYAQTQDFCARTDVILNLLEDFERKHHRPTEDELQDIIALHRQQLQQKTGLKDTPKRKVSRVNYKGKSLIVKEFCEDGNCRNHALTSYRNSIILNRISPMPLRYMATGNSHVIIFEDAGRRDCMRCEDFFNSTPDIQEIFADCGRVLALLHKNGYYHNDTKASNFVVNENCPGIPYKVTLVDCDFLKKGRSISHAKQIKNLAQFLALTHQIPMDSWHETLRTVLHAYATECDLAEQTEHQFYQEIYRLIAEHKVESWLANRQRTMPAPGELFP